MTAEKEQLMQQAENVLEKTRWQGSVTGRIEGAMNVLYLLDLTMERRIELLSNAVGLSQATARDFIEPREIEERIQKNQALSHSDREALVSLVLGDTLNDDEIMANPGQVIRILSSVSGTSFMDEAVAKTEEWIRSSEGVSPRRIKNWLIEEYAGVHYHAIEDV